MMTNTDTTTLSELEAAARIHRVRAQVAENNNREVEAQRHRVRLARVEQRLAHYQNN